MRFHAGVLMPLLLLAACGSSGPRHSARLLDQRLNERLAGDVGAGVVTVQPIDDGDRVTLLGLSAYVADPTAEGQRSDAKASVVEALLDPSLMRVEVADTSDLPPYQRDMRVRDMRRYFTGNGLESVLLPPGPEGAAGTGGLVLTIHVACPPPDGFVGYRDGRARPMCD